MSDTPSASDATQVAWDFTRDLATRRYVNVMTPEADGVIRANNYPRKFPIVGLRPPDAPWTVDLTDEHGRFWLAPFDLDAKQPEDFAQASEDLGVLIRLLRRLALPHVVCKSSPTGGYHVFLPLAGLRRPLMQELGAAARAVLPSLDFGLLSNERTGAVRPPGTPHARGGHSQVMPGDHDIDVLLERSINEADLRRLIAALRELRPELDPVDEKATGPVAEHHRTHRALAPWGERHMATIAGGNDPSRTGYLCLIAAAEAGWSIQDVERAVQSAPGLEHYRTRNNPTGERTRRPPHEAQARLRRQWSKALEHVASRPYRPAVSTTDISELRGIVTSVEAMLQAFRVSPGRWSTEEASFHDANVLVAIGWMSLHSGSRDVAAAVRSVAGLTGIPSSTVDRSLRRLRSAGWISLRRAADGSNAAVYQLTERFSTGGEQVGPLQDVTARPPEQVFDVRAALVRELDERIDAGRHDVFSRDGLGPTARRTFEALRPEDADSLHVAARAGLAHGRAKASLARLRRHGLAVSTSAGWRRRARDLRQRVARALGVAGTLRRREQLYADERTLWTWWNADVARLAGGTAGKRVPQRPQRVMFRIYDERGGPEDWPAYPRSADGRGEHRMAWRYVRTGTLQDLRDDELELSAA